MKASVSRRMPSAAPQDVWDVISDPHRHVRTLPTSVSQVEVLGSGEISCTVSAMGKSERMLVRRTTLDPPRRLVEERVDGIREGTTEFVVEPDGGGSRVTLTAVVALPRLVAGLARGHIEQGLTRQLELLEQEASS
ncbi:MAG TPA: SRPBCC family protein [Gaiellales bacterium]|nr:SRPBCC family protein [Gaiellales bacterium]